MMFYLDISKGKEAQHAAKVERRKLDIMRKIDFDWIPFHFSIIAMTTREGGLKYTKVKTNIKFLNGDLARMEKRQFKLALPR